MKNTLNRYIELADKITDSPDEQKLKAFCNLMAKIETAIPNVITANQKAIESNTELRFWHIHSPFKPFNEYDNIALIGFIKERHGDIQAWEQETGDILKERQNNIEKYKQTDWIRYANGEKHPDIIYCKGGKYWRWNEQKNSPYFRLFWQIWQQGNTADFETICKMVCLYIVLKNEADIIADELRLIGQLPQQANEPTTARLITDIEQLPQQQQQAIREGIKSQIEAQILVQKAANPDGLNDYLKAELANATAAMQTLIQESQKDGAIMPTISKNFVWNMERAKKLRQYLPPTSTQPTEATPTATATTPANLQLCNPKLQQAIKNAQKTGFVRFEDGVYKAKDKSWLVVFASELKAKGITTTQYADIETIFGLDSGELARKWQKVSNQKNYDKIRNTILPLLADI